MQTTEKIEPSHHGPALPLSIPKSSRIMARSIIEGLGEGDDGLELLSDLQVIIATEVAARIAAEECK